MEENKEVVNTVDTTTTEQQADTQVGDTTTATPEQETTETQTTPESGQTQKEDVDERGVPWKNVAMEWQRKFQENTNEETLERVARRVLEEKKQPQQPEYSISQLELYKLQNADNPQAVAWAEEQKAELLGKRFEKIAEDKAKAVEKKQTETVRRQQAETWVLNHPRLQECFVPNQFGQKVWNNMHPLTQMIGMNMNDPDLRNRPDALQIAAKLALADYMEMQQPQTQKKVKTLQQSLKKAQKQTFVEGDSTQRDAIKNKTAYNKAFDAFRTTGSKESLAEVLREKLKRGTQE